MIYCYADIELCLYHDESIRGGKKWERGKDLLGDPKV